MDTTLQTIFKELKELAMPLGVLSTVSTNGVPHATTVYYVFDETLSLYVLMREDSKKYQNILNNPNVAFVVTQENPPKTLQFEGTAHIVTDPHEENEFFSKLVSIATEKSAIPPVSQTHGGKIIFVKLSPRWVRFGNFELSKEGEVFQEVKL